MDKDLNSMTLAELREAARDAGLPTFGSKADLQFRLQNAAASELAAHVEEHLEDDLGLGLGDAPTDPQPEPMPEAEIGVEAIPVPQPAPAARTMPPIVDAYGDRLVTLKTIQNRFNGVVAVKYDASQDVYQFEGGPQKRWTTTGKQPMESVIKAAREYANITINAPMHNGALGKVGG